MSGAALITSAAELLSELWAPLVLINDLCVLHCASYELKSSFILDEAPIGIKLKDTTTRVATVWIFSGQRPWAFRHKQNDIVPNTFLGQCQMKKISPQTATEMERRSPHLTDETAPLGRVKPCFVLPPKKSPKNKADQISHLPQSRG